MKELDKYIDNLKNEMQQYGNAFLESCTPEQELLFLYSFYHYFGADSSKIDEIESGMVYKADADDKIAGIYIDEDSDNNDVDAVLVYRDGGAFDTSSILSSMKNAEEVLISSIESKKGNHPELHDILSREEYKLSTNRIMKVVLLTDYNTKSAANKKTFMKAFTELKPVNANVTYSVVFGYDIEHEILEIENPNEYSCAMKSHFRKTGNQQSGSGNQRY